MKNNRSFEWPAKKYGTLMNIDTDALTYFSRTYGGDLSDIEKKCNDYFERYVNSGISDLIYNIDGNVPTDTCEWRGDFYTRKEERGIAVDYSENEGIKILWHVYKETDVDPYSIWLSRAWESGMRPWLSFRMNDVHYACSPTGHSEFFYKAKDNGWMVGDYHSPTSWYGYALDYSVPEVRRHFLDIISALTQKYDAFGIDLDFHRTIRCFKELDESNAEYMTEFLRDVNGVLKQAEKKWGHPWRVMIRLCQSVDLARKYGFDIETLVAEKLVDAFVPASYWGSTDNAIPIWEWKHICPNDVPIFWGIEANTINFRHLINADSVAGYMLTADAAGADGMYQYNTFGAPWAWKLGTVEDAYSVPVRRFLTTQNDFKVVNYNEYEPHYFPINVAPNADAEHKMTVGELKTNEDILVFVGVDPEDKGEQLRVFFNGKETKPLGKSGKSYMEKYYPDFYEEQKTGRYPWRIYTYRVPKAACEGMDGVATLNFVCPEECNVYYAEIANGNIE